MRRQEIRKLKRAVDKEGDLDAMQTLLLRSVRMGHRRLALLRCLQAQRMGVGIDQSVLAYCRQVANEMAPCELAAMLAY